MNRRRIGIISALVLALAVGSGLLYYANGSRGRADDAAAKKLAGSLLSAIAAADPSALPLDQAGSSAEQIQLLLESSAKDLGSPELSLVNINRTGSKARGLATVTREPIPGQRWNYDLPIILLKEKTWKISADQPFIHPEIPPDVLPTVSRKAAPRAIIEGAGGTVLIEPRAVVVVGVEPRKIAGSISQFADKLGKITEISPAPLAAKITAAKPTDFVEVITLRKADYSRVSSQLRALAGIILREQELPLAPTREFARALIGTVGPVTADIVEGSRGRYKSGDQAGLSGLQRQFDSQLAGTAGISIMMEEKEIFSTAPQAGKPLAISLEAKVQQAADTALLGVTAPSAIVAVRISTGALAAVANSPASGLNRALLGRYAPGSTFKMVSTLALLQKGISVNQTVNCPKEATVSGRKFTNYQDEEFGAVPFSQDFALSCNTAFVGLSSKLSSTDLKNTAASLGVGQKWPLGVESFSGSVPQTVSDVDLAAATFGQGRSEFSPAALAVATASVARGSYLPPTLVNPSASTATATKLPAEVTSVQKLMRLVVTEGTGSSLKTTPGAPVHAKTGTAEFGTESPPKTRAWMIGWQGDLAFAVLVEEGKSGGSVAGPVAAKFLKNATG